MRVCLHVSECAHECGVCVYLFMYKLHTGHTRPLNIKTNLMSTHIYILYDIQNS